MLKIVPKIHGGGIETVNFRASGHYSITPYWSRSWHWGWYQKIQIMVILRASMLNKIPKIHGRDIKAVDAKASGLCFTTPSWAQSWHWGWYQIIPIMFVLRAIMLKKVIKIQGWGIKTVHARASGLHFQTPFWAWGRPRGWYPKFDLTRLSPYALLMSYSKIIFLALLVTEIFAHIGLFFLVFYYM